MDEVDRPAVLAAVLRMSGPGLSEDEIAALLRGPLSRIDAMVALNAGTGLDRFAESATTFDPEQA
jgi:hypothetical protein